MSYNSIFYILLALSVTLSLAYLSKATSKRVAGNEQGQYLLRMHKLYYIVGIISLVIAAVFLIAPFTTDDESLAFYVMIFLMLLIFGVPGLLSVLYFKRHYALFDDTKIEVSSASGKVKTLLWNEIEKATFNPASGLLTLSSKNGEKVSVHYHLVGFPTFIELLEKKTAWTAEQLKLPVKRK